MFEVILMIIAALIPTAAIIGFICYRDRKHPEPFGLLALAVFLGVLSVVLDIIVCLVGISPFEYVFLSLNIPFTKPFFEAFLMAGIPEESCKLLLLWLLLRKNKSFDENMDGIVYAVMIGMGFAGLENIKYLFEAFSDSFLNGVITAISRAVLAVPGHYMFAVLMGFFYSLVHFAPRRFGKYRILVWLAPVLVHGTYDCLLMLGDEAYNYFGDGLGSLISLFTFALTIGLCILIHSFCFTRLHAVDLMDQDRDDLNTFTKAMKKS